MPTRVLQIKDFVVGHLLCPSSLHLCEAGFQQNLASRTPSLHPNVFKKAGTQVHAQRIFHIADTLIIFHARAYHSVVNLGYSISSATKIANSTWFSTVSALVKRTVSIQPRKPILIPFERRIWE